MLTEDQKAKMRAAYRKRWADPEKRKKILAENRERAKAHPEWGRKAALKWRHNNIEKARAWANAHPESSRKRALAWRNRNLEKARESTRQWHKKNRAWRQAWDHEKRARKKAVTINPKSIQLFIKAVRGSKLLTCYYCEKPISGKKAHIDHIIPLSKGGPHSVENLCVACPRCNQTKLNRLIRDWMRLGQQLLEL